MIEQDALVLWEPEKAQALDRCSHFENDNHKLRLVTTACIRFEETIDS